MRFVLSRFLPTTFAIIALGSSSIALSAEDAGHGDDYRTFHADGRIDKGKIQASYDSDLVMYLAGNQFMAMEELITDFQLKNPDIETIYVETIPPGQILNGQILKQGMIDGQKTSRTPDLFASVNLGHLKKLAAESLMTDYATYTHNKLELMVAKGNPKRSRVPRTSAGTIWCNRIPIRSPRASSGSTDRRCSRTSTSTRR